MKILKKGVYILALLLLSIPFSCDEDDDFKVIQGLDFTVATLNAEGNKTGVVATTIPPDGRITYTVDFGNPNDDADVFQTSGPMVTYDYPLESATYTIMVTASLPGREDVSITKTHTVIYIVEPDPTPNSPLTGTWKLAPEAGALGVGDGMGNTNWWANSVADVTTRACLFDDEYVFNADGTFENRLGSETWLEAWQGTDPEACGTPVSPHDGTASATYTYNEAMQTLTIEGTGAFMGLAKVVNGAEIASPADVASSITYITELSSDGNTLELDIEVAGGGWWSFKFQKEAPPAPSVLEGTWKLAPEAGALGVGEGMGNTNWWANSVADVTTRACLFDDEYVFNADGTFENRLGSETWLEGWQGTDPEACGTPVAPHDGSASATYTHDQSGGTLTLNGTGAFLGLAKVINGAELASPASAANTITYIAELSSDGNTLELDIEVSGGGWWSFKLVKDAPSNPIVGTWKLAPEAGALGVGEGMGNTNWWANSVADVTTRACLFDDEYIFNADGTFENILGSETWLEGWQGTDPEACGTPVAPHDGSASATYSYDQSGGTLTLNGTGAFLGLAKVINGAELASPSSAASSITYIVELSSDGNTLELDIEVSGGGWWSFKFTKQ